MLIISISRFKQYPPRFDLREIAREVQPILHYVYALQLMRQLDRTCETIERLIEVWIGEEELVCRADRLLVVVEVRGASHTQICIPLLLIARSALDVQRRQ